MDNDRKRQLRELYENTKPQMGILMFHCIPTGHKYFMPVTDTRAKLNGVIVRLNGNMYNRGSRNKNIQAEWNQYGESQFEKLIVDTLDYDKDETKTDYSEELSMLLDDWLKENPGSEAIL